MLCTAEVGIDIGADPEDDLADDDSPEFRVDLQVRDGARLEPVDCPPARRIRGTRIDDAPGPRPVRTGRVPTSDGRCSAGGGHAAGRDRAPRQVVRDPGGLGLRRHRCGGRVPGDAQLVLGRPLTRRALGAARLIGVRRRGMEDCGAAIAGTDDPTTVNAAMPAMIINFACT
jgi:hypothetical protein